MAIPKDILALKPKNTRVKATRKPNEYNVIKRTCVMKNGKPTPKELGIIGKIINGVYTPIEKPVYEVEFKSYGCEALIEKYCKDIFEKLCRVYAPEDAKKIYVMALLRVINEDIKDGEIALEYQTSFISEIFPKLGLSANSISGFLDKIGKSTTLMENFMSSRIQEYEKDTVVVDGMLKSSNGESNIYSEYSRKGKIKGSKDINLIYAYDIENEEPLACTPYAGNMLDYTAFEDFIKTYPIKNGFIILDKGFDDDKTVKENLRKLETKFLVPIKNTSKVIKEYKLDNDFQDCFKYEQDNIRCKKIKVNDNKYYYAFKSSEAKSMQDKGYIARNLKKGAFNETAYNKKESLFGLIVFESNYDGKLKDIYDAYQRRWEIEILFSKYKNLINRTEENVHGTYRLMSTEFINFISCIMVSRIKKAITKSKEASKYSLPKIMRLLSKCTKKRATKNPENWVDSAMLKYVKELCLDLGI